MRLLSALLFHSHLSPCVFFKIQVTCYQPDEAFPDIVHFQVDLTPSSCFPPVLCYSCVLLLQLPKNFVPVFVSTVSLLLPGGRSLRQRLGVYVSSISLI